MSTLLKQYETIKVKYPDAILLFRVGDYYQTFEEDAKVVAHQLGVALTGSMAKKGNTGVAGFPFYEIDTHLRTLVRAGYKVALCEQLEDPHLTRGGVKRGVTEVKRP